MVRLSDFMHCACAEARSVAKRGRDSSTESVASPRRPAQSPQGPTHCTPDQVLPARGLHTPRCLQRHLMTPTYPLIRCCHLRCPSVFLAERRFSLIRPGQLRVPRCHPSETQLGLPLRLISLITMLPSIRQQATLPVSLPFPRFATPGPELSPAPAQPQPVVTQKYHSPPGSGSSTPLYDLAEFDPANSSVTRWELDVASVVPSDISPIVTRFTPPNPQGSQVPHLSSVQLSPNRTFGF